jgi:alpha-galactosidase
MTLAWGDGGAVMAIGWSGQWLASFERDEKRSLRVQTGMEHFRVKLHPGEGIRTPRMLLLFWRGEEMLRGHNLFRQFMLKHGIPRIEGRLVVPPVAASFAGLNDYTEVNQIAVAPKYGERGIELQWIDAGWFVGGWPNGAGTWEPKPENFPRGLAPVGEAVHKAGMKFLLWFEIERVARGSEIAREHPEWVIGPITEYGGLFNWGIAEARRWMTDRVSDQLRKGKVDIFRMDFNMEPLMYWLRNDPPDRQGMTEIRFVEGMYRMWDDLRVRHPGLWVNNCASGSDVGFGDRHPQYFVNSKRRAVRGGQKCQCGCDWPTAKRRVKSVPAAACRRLFRIGTVLRVSQCDDLRQCAQRCG